MSDELAEQWAAREGAPPTPEDVERMELARAEGRLPRRTIVVTDEDVARWRQAGRARRQQLIDLGVLESRPSE